MYKIKNISRCLAFAGLYPGKSKIIQELSPELIKLKENHLLTIIETKKEIIKKEEKINEDKIEKEEVND